ncbi:hypothetical protein [Chryseobacterium camelliae]|uniref:hypothetical protein n=1 Tax=Chryseobacterium camelliae TaxID=1265445 RepID=UPI0027D801AF|nr:hypothetical protein [Chryseobacterium camelliae]
MKVLSLNDKLQDIKVTHRPKSDSVRIWFDAAKSNVGQTANENLKFSYNADNKQDTVSVFYRYNTKNVMTLDSDNGGALIPPKADFKMVSNYIIDRIEPEKWMLRVAGDTLSKQQFSAVISPTNPYQVIVKSDFVIGKKYQLTVPKETVYSFYAKNPQSKRFDFEIDKADNYGSLTLTLQNAPASNYWIQLLDASDKVVYQKYTKGSQVRFDILKPSEYIVRILADNNGNGYWDEADFQNQVFAEDAYTYYKVVVIRPLWDTNETWDLSDTRSLENPKGTSATAAGTDTNAAGTTNPVTAPSAPVQNNKVIETSREVLKPVR